MSFYHKIYTKLCLSSQSQKDKYGQGSGLHKHRINPGHQGGIYEEDNITYLTPREHTIAHFLLWKMNKNPNDLRAMYMISAKLTPEHRKIIGIWCRDNKIGFHAASSEQKAEWAKKGMDSQKLSENKNSFYWWSTPEGRSKRASMGGAIGGKVQAIKQIGMHDPEVRKIATSKGGKSHIGKIWITTGTRNTRIFPSLLTEYINNGWRRAMTKY